MNRHVTVVGAFQTACLLAGLTVLCAGAATCVTPEGFALPQRADPVKLAAQGQALVPIVISPDASDAVRTLAVTLQDHLQRITGASFVIETNATPGGITLGTVTNYPDSALREALAVRNYYDGREAFVIRSDGGRIRLLGNTDLGVSHALYRFLELLGCRWFFMGPNWTIIPSTRTLTFGIDETSRPAMWSRSIWFDRLAQAGEPGDPNAREVFQTWGRCNRMDQSLRIRASHAWHAIPAVFKAEFDVHPEWFARVDGERRGPQFCVTNPDLQKIIVAYTRKQFDDDPEADMVSLDPADTAGWCTCDACVKLGHHSAQPFFLANVVARALQASHPGKFVGLLAYSWHSDPPEFKLEPNVHVQLTRGMNASGLDFDELFKLWTSKCEVMSIYEYYSYWEMDEGMLPGTKVTDIRRTAQEIRDYVASGSVKGISGQSSCSWGIHGLGYYVANRLMWHPQADVESLRRDFLDKSFGTAAPAMGRFFDLFDVGNNPLRGLALLARGIGELQEATRLAAGDGASLARIDDLKRVVIYSFIGEKIKAMEYGGGADAAEERALALSWFTWAYRIRNSYMMPWLTFRSSYGRPISEKLKEPDFFWRNTVREPKRNPWRVDDPVTSQELDQRLAAIALEVGPVPVMSATTNSRDYVVAAMGQPVGGQRDRSIRASVLATYLLGSLEGEPIEVTIEHPDAAYTLSGADGREIAAAKLPVGVHSLKLAVPAAGAYPFSCHSRGRGFHLVVPASVPGAMTFEPGNTYRPSGFTPPLFFYVPQGTKAVMFHAHRSGVIVIRNGDGQVVHQARSDGRYVSVPVTAGQDGRVWSLGDEIGGPGAGMRLRCFSFLNLPNALSFSPNQIFVPREIAVRDGLKMMAPALPRQP
jgi:hypothetical protein